MSEHGQYAVIVTRPDGPDRPDDAPLTVRIGPYAYRTQAEAVAGHLTFSAHARSRPEGTTAEPGPYDPALPHRPTLYGADMLTVADAITAEGDDGGAWSFPDTYDLLHGVYTVDEAQRRYMAACEHLDAMAAHAGEEQRAAERERRDAEPEAYRLAPCRDATAAA
ncbi:hypothetical protein AB0O64_37925, partial [Streptomyces sp. NPDC088341]